MLAHAQKLPPFVLFQDDLLCVRRIFSNPIDILTAHTADEVHSVLIQMEALKQQNKWLAGCVFYEAGFAFEPKLTPLLSKKQNVPLLVMGVFDAPEIHSFKRADPSSPPPAPLKKSQPLMTRGDYAKMFYQAHRHIAEGDCYQVNLTFPIKARWRGDLITLFDILTTRQPVPHSAIINLNNTTLLSRSPELFFEINAQGFIETRPMKGTAKRGHDAETDAHIRNTLEQDGKNQSENRMIVDLLRNDISRIITPSSLEVPALFEVETYASLHQMISRVRGKLIPNITISDILIALFPCGSITGAPKIRAMEIIHALEKFERNAYCGSIGWIAPNGEMQFNVAIRTLIVEQNGDMMLNVGSGVTFDSKMDEEYEECLLKAQFACGTVPKLD
jgi:para-aminobenzoate synthetase component I